MNKNEKKGKGRRLILLHTIDENGPLVDVDNSTGRPIDELTWKEDTPHAKMRLDRKVTADLLWVAQSHAGNYHDDMNSDMCMK